MAASPPSGVDNEFAVVLPQPPQAAGLAEPETPVRSAVALEWLETVRCQPDGGVQPYWAQLPPPWNAPRDPAGTVSRARETIAPGCVPPSGDSVKCVERP